MSVTTAVPASAGFNMGIMPAGSGFGTTLSQQPSSLTPQPTPTPTPDITSSGAVPSGSPSPSQFTYGNYLSNVSPDQLMAAINADPNDTSGKALVDGGMSLSQIQALSAANASNYYQGEIDPSQIQYNGKPLSSYGTDEHGMGEYLLGNFQTNPGLTYQGKPISNKQQTDAYWQLANGQTHGAGKAIGFAAALVASCFLGPEILAAYEGVMGAGMLATVAAGATTGALAGGLDAGISGGDVGKGMLGGALTGGVGAGVGGALAGSVADGTISSGTANVISAAAKGGTGALINGGDVGKGILSGAATGAVGSGVSSALSSSVDDGSISSDTAKAITSAATSGTSAAINGHGGFAGVLTSAAIGAAGSEANSFVTDATGSDLAGKLAGGATSFGLNAARQSGSPSTTYTNTAANPAANPATTIQQPPRVGTVSGFNMGVNTKQGA